MSNNYILYKHTSPSKKVYIGITKRLPEQRYNYGHGYRGNPHFFNAIKKYGWNNFSHEVLESGLSEEEAKKREIELISLYDSTNPSKGYNRSPGGDLLSVDSIQKIAITRKTNGTDIKESIRMKALWRDNDYRTKVLANMRGKHRTEEQKERYRKALTGRKLHAETKKKLSEISSLRIGELSNRAKKVLQIDMTNGEIINVYPTARQAALENGIKSINAISNTCRGKGTHYCHGSLWCYENDYVLLKTKIDNGEIPELETHRHTRKVLCVETGELFESIKEACETYNIKSHGSIAQQIHGSRKTVAGHTWAYTDENGNIIDVKKQPTNRLCTNAQKEAVSKAHRKPIKCNETGYVYKSIADAERRINGKYTGNIARALRGKAKTAFGYTWSYVEKQVV